jgi:L-asparaginase
MPPATMRRVHVLALGGTIAMASDDGGGVKPAFDADALVAAVPELTAVAQIDAETLMDLPSAHLRLGDVVATSHRISELVGDGVDGVVVTQGTDTLEETAFALDLLLAPGRTVVVTGAMRSPQLPGADGPANLLAAVRVAADDLARDAGVLVTLNGEIHAARWVVKGHTTRPSAFISPTTGPIGWVTEDRVRLPLHRAERLHVPVPRSAPLPAIALVRVALGDDGRLLEALPDLRYDGVVIEAMGVGHLPHWFVEPLERLAATLPVVLTTRVLAGETFRGSYGFPGSEQDLLGRGLLWSGALDGLKSRVLLALTLAAGWDRRRIADAFEAMLDPRVELAQ